MSGSVVKVIALVVPLGLDTFGVALALGIAGLPAERRTRIALLFSGFEAGMPLLGVLLGLPLGRAIGSAADYVAAGVVAALGVYMLVDEDGEQDSDRLLSLTQGGLYGVIALGVSISLDELAIGLSAGLLRLPLLVLVLAVAAQAFVVTQIGVRVGARVGAGWSGRSETVAGIALLALAAILIGTRLTS